MLKGLGDLGKMGNVLKQAMELKGRIEEIKAALAEERVEVSVGGGMVSVVMTGKMDVVSIKIEPEVVNKDDVEMLETLVRSAVNEAAARVRQLVETRMREAAGGIEIPGFNL